jgi:hypothetical protein
MYATFDNFEIKLTKAEAESATHPGPCDADVEVLLSKPYIRKQLDAIGPVKIAAELAEYGAWSAIDDSDHEVQ